MTLETLLPFLLAALVMELTPGPNMAYLALVAARSGRRMGFAAVAGVTLGLAVYLLAAVAGIAEVAQRWPWIYQTLRWAGVGYLLWLAFDAWRDDPRQVATADSAGLGRVFLRGLLANLLNPKAALLYVALLPGFISPAGDPVAQAIILGAVHLAVSLVVHGVIVVSAGSAQRLLAARGVWTGRIMALALVAVALWVAVSTR